MQCPRHSTRRMLCPRQSPDDQHSGGRNTTEGTEDKERDTMEPVLESAAAAQSLQNMQAINTEAILRLISGSTASTSWNISLCVLCDLCGGKKNRFSRTTSTDGQPEDADMASADAGRFCSQSCGARERGHTHFEPVAKSSLRPSCLCEKKRKVTSDGRVHSRFGPDHAFAVVPRESGRCFAVTQTPFGGPHGEGDPTGTQHDSLRAESGGQAGSNGFRLPQAPQHKRQFHSTCRKMLCPPTVPHNVPKDAVSPTVPRRCCANHASAVESHA